MNGHQRAIVRSYLLLMLLTAFSAYLGSLAPALLAEFSPYIISAIVMLTLIKGWQIVDVFMELKHAPPLWRRLLLAYVIMVQIVIGVIYSGS